MDLLTGEGALVYLSERGAGWLEFTRGGKVE